ncbi:MAG: FAD-dependent oxidoreductase [Bradyrhizobium sp.]
MARRSRWWNFSTAFCRAWTARVAKQFQRILEKQGFAFKLGAKVTGIDTSGKTLSAQIEPAAGGAAETLEADVVLVCIGRVAYTEGLGLKEAGVALDNRGAGADRFAFCDQCERRLCDRRRRRGSDARP